MDPLKTIKDFDLFLKNRKLSFSAIVIGGAALNIMNVIHRDTQDVDILDPEIPKEILKAAEDFARTTHVEGIMLLPDWFNDISKSLRDHLPMGWRGRTKKIFEGEALTLFSLGRSDLLKTKLYAYCDRGEDEPDCIALKVTKEEMLEALPWISFQDGNPDWPDHVKKVLAPLARKLGYEL